MKRTVTATILGAGVLSALLITAPTGAAQDLEQGTWQNWSVLPDAAKATVIEELLKTRQNHILADQPAALVRKVDGGCKVADKNGSSDRQ